MILRSFIENKKYDTIIDSINFEYSLGGGLQHTVGFNTTSHVKHYNMMINHLWCGK